MWWDVGSHPAVGVRFDRRRFYPVIEHPARGRIHSSHIPLEFLAAHFPEAFAKITAYRSFALIREPMSRFASATFQRLKGFRRIAPAQITTAMALGEAEAVMDWLGGRRSFCDFDYIHFARQRDYVRLGDQWIVRHLFALEDMASFAAALQETCGIRLDPERRENTNFASADPVSRGVRRLLKPVYSRLTTWEFRQRVLLRLKKAGGARTSRSTRRSAPTGASGPSSKIIIRTILNSMPRSGPEQVRVTPARGSAPDRVQPRL